MLNIHVKIHVKQHCQTLILLMLTVNFFNPLAISSTNTQAKYQGLALAPVMPSRLLSDKQAAIIQSNLGAADRVSFG